MFQRSLAALMFCMFAGLSPLTLAEDLPERPLPVRFFRALANGESQTVVVYGTSLTMGGAWAKSLKAYFDETFPGKVRFHNAAKAGVDSRWGLAHFKDRVLDKKPDLVFLEFAVNDAATKNGVSLDDCEKNLDEMVKAFHEQNPQGETVLQTMDPAWDSPASPKKYGSDRPTLAEYYAVWRRYAVTHQLPLVDHYSTWLKLQKEDTATYQKMVPDGIHPNAEASNAVTWPAVRAMLEQARRAANEEPAGRPAAEQN